MKLHVGNLPFSVEDNELKELFSEYNPEEVTLIKDKFSGRSKGFGFVTISDDEVANKAIWIIILSPIKNLIIVTLSILTQENNNQQLKKRSIIKIKFSGY